MREVRDGNAYTYADYLTWKDGQRWEIIDGEAHCISPAPSLDHQTIVTELVAQVATALRGHPCQVFASPVDVRLPKVGVADHQVDRVVQPDLLVVCDPKKLDRRGVVGAPDFVVEVVSPSSASHDHVRKRRLYESAGVKELWLIMPNDRFVAQYMLGPEGYGRPELWELEGETAVACLPGVVVDWAPVVARLGAGRE